MSKLDQAQATGDLNTGSNAALGPAEGFPGFGEKAGSLLGGGIEKFGRGIEQAGVFGQRYEHHMKMLADRQKAQDESFEIATAASNLRTQFNDRLNDYKDNPSEDTLNTFNNEYDSYTEDMLKNASSPNVAKELTLKAQEYKLHFANEAHSIQTQTRQANFGAGYQQMISNAEDSIFASKTLDELKNQKDLLNQAVDGAVNTGRIKDPQVIEGLKSRADMLNISWAEANMSDNPQLVKDVVNGEEGYEGIFKGVSVHHKEVLLNKADSVISTQDDYDKVALHQELESDIVQRMKTGEGNSLNLERYENAYGKSARNIAELRLNNATRLNSVVEGVKGADNEKLQKILNDSQPKSDPNDATYAEQYKYSEQVQQIVQQAVSDKKNDAFGYFAQNPALKSLVQDVNKNIAKTGPDQTVDTQKMTEQAELNLRNAVLNLQKMDKSLSPDDYKVMPAQEAHDFIEKFNGLTEVGNQTDGAGVRDLLSRFADRYKDNLPVALNQLSKIKGGETVTPLLNPLMWHLSNPTTFRLTLDALRKDPKEQMARFGSTKEKDSFLTDAHLDSNFLSYQNSILAANNSPEAQSLVNGVKEAYTAFARDYVLNGGKVKDASSLFFSNYSWGSLNGNTYARPRVYTDTIGKQHTMSDQEVNTSNAYLEAYPTRLLDDKKIDPTTILNQTKYFTSEQIASDVKNALRNNVFWSTTGDETGVYLFTKGSVNGTAKQVKDKQGNPIRVNFLDTIKPVTLPKSSGERLAPNTGDTWLDRLSNAILSSG